MENIGNRIYQSIASTRNLLFIQGEIAQLTYQSFIKYIEITNNSDQTHFEVTSPIGFKPDNTTMDSTAKFSKKEIESRYRYLGLTQLPINGIYHLVTSIEALLSDILRIILLEFPHKIPNKKKLDFELVLEASSIDEIKLNIVNSILNELAYKSPKDYAEEFLHYVGVNLREKPAFHKYIELKSTRDIYIHNQGIANSIYVTKAETLARVLPGQHLPVDVQYFLQSYESCLQITEILEQALNNIWPSTKYKAAKLRNFSDEKEDAIEKAIESAESKKTKKPSGKPRLTSKRK